MLIPHIDPDQAERMPLRARLLIAAIFFIALALVIANSVVDRSRAEKKVQQKQPNVTRGTP